MKTSIDKQKRAFLSLANQQVEKGFAIDANNRKVVGDLFSYFCDIESSLDPRKGLWLMGDVGTGKTTLMRLFAEFARERSQGFKIHTCSDVASRYALTGNLDLYTLNREGYLGHPVAMCFDDLGREPLEACYFGQRLNVMQHILHVRYSLWQTSGLKTFVTTNCDVNDVEALYGRYIRDRVREMFNIVIVGGQSRRRA